MSVSQDNKTIARAAAAAFGGDNFRVIEYWDDNQTSSVDILSLPESPYAGLVSYSTIGLSDHSIGYTVDSTPLRVEFVGACATESDIFPNILSTCAFYVINDRFSCYPGAIFRDIIDMYIPSSPMKHVMFVTPFLWEDRPHSVQLSGRKVVWLMAVPISEAERRYAEAHGTDALGELFAERNIDIADLNRPSEVE